MTHTRRYHILVVLFAFSLCAKKKKNVWLWAVLTKVMR